MSAVNFALGALTGAAATAVAADAYPSMLPSLGFSRPKDIELKYFDFAGAAEKVRFTLLMGGVPFKDTRVNFADWGKMKETTKFGQLPLMYLNGEEKPYAQSGAMLRFAGAITGLMDNSSDLVSDGTTFSKSDVIYVPFTSLTLSSGAAILKGI